MGYCISQQGSNFFIAKEDKAAALAAVKALANNTSQMSGGSYAYGAKRQSWYSWVNTDEFANARTLEDAMDAWRYCPDTDEDGNIVDVNFEGEKLGDETVLFAALAPFVKSGSYIEMNGEDGSIWRWCFVDGKFEEKHAQLVWD